MNVVATVTDDGTGNRWLASVVWSNGIGTPRRADEGGTHDGGNAFRLCALEAEERALRVVGGDASRVSRIGYTLEDADRARALVRQAGR